MDRPPVRFLIGSTVGANPEEYGFTLRYARRMNLAAMVPRNDLTSTGYCLANPGVEYLVYLPEGGSVTVDLTASSKAFVIEWMYPDTGETMIVESATGGSSREFTAPCDGDAVLYIVDESTTREGGMRYMEAVPE